MSFRGKLRSVAIDLDNGWDDLRLELSRSLGGPGPLRILAYRGLGRPDRLMVRGRVLVDRGPTTCETDGQPPEPIDELIEAPPRTEQSDPG
ncbi:MAG: hypothetical protein WBP34_15770 [Thermoanaerobaculia bacterium]